jgi:hypothetical protein
MFYAVTLYIILILTDMVYVQKATYRNGESAGAKNVCGDILPLSVTSSSRGA